MKTSLPAVIIPHLALAGLTPVFTAALAGHGPRRLLALTGAAVALLAAEAIAVGVSSRSLRRRVVEDTMASNPLTVTHLRDYPGSLVLRIGVIAALGGPLGLIVAAVAAGLPTGELLLESGPALLLAQAVFLFPVHLLTRSRIAPLLELVKHPAEPPTSRRPLLRRLFVALLIPSVAGALLLAFGVNRILTNGVLQRAVYSYRSVADAVLAAPAKEAASPSDMIAALTRYEEATPFALLSDGRTAGQRIDSADAAIVRRGQSHGESTALLTDGTLLVWSKQPGSGALLGIRVQPEPDQPVPFILISLLLTAALGSALVAIWRGPRTREQLTSLRAHLEAMTDDEPPPQPEQKIRTPEITGIEEELVRLADRFQEMRGIQSEAIETGREMRTIKTQFFAGMSHDLRSPLNSIVGFTELLLKGIDGSLAGRQRQAVLSIAQESERLLVLIESILDTSKLEAGKLDMARTWVPSVEILTDCVAAAQRLVGSKPIELSRELQPGLPPVFVDLDRIRQALISLLYRAISSMDAGVLRLKASLEHTTEGLPPLLRVDIIDPGHVIPSAERERIVQASRSSTSGGGAGGLGLGLALARDIVTMHGGELDVAGDGSGGPLFTMVLPLDESGEELTLEEA